MTSDLVRLISEERKKKWKKIHFSKENSKKTTPLTRLICIRYRSKRLWLACSSGILSACVISNSIMAVWIRHCCERVRVKLANFRIRRFHDSNFCAWVGSCTRVWSYMYKIVCYACMRESFASVRERMKFHWLVIVIAAVTWRFMAILRCPINRTVDNYHCIECVIVIYIYCIILSCESGSRFRMSDLKSACKCTWWKKKEENYCGGKNEENLSFDRVVRDRNFIRPTIISIENEKWMKFW